MIILVEFGSLRHNWPKSKKPQLRSLGSLDIWWYMSASPHLRLAFSIHTHFWARKGYLWTKQLSPSPTENLSHDEITDWPQFIWKTYPSIYIWNRLRTNHEKSTGSPDQLRGKTMVSTEHFSLNQCLQHQPSRHIPNYQYILHIHINLHHIFTPIKSPRSHRSMDCKVHP